MKSLKDKVALVAGATRGAGRGIAVELGAAGATVYCTGRSTREQRSEINRPETIEDMAETVRDVGGKGTAVQMDHLDQQQVKSLVALIEREQGCLDVLVNDIWGGDWLTAWNVHVLGTFTRDRSCNKLSLPTVLWRFQAVREAERRDSRGLWRTSLINCHPGATCAI
ncbi:MAG TPA: SDR family NAD(P)-dependent oxidoreductase [Pyrinomonadaceae bacterium]